MSAKRASVIILLCAAALAAGCGKEEPVVPDGEATIVIAAADTSGAFPGSVQGELFPMQEAQVTIESRSHVYTGSAETDEDGVAAFEGLDAGTYSLFVRREIVDGAFKRVFTGYTNVVVSGKDMASDTIYVQSTRASSLTINEIFYAGSCASSYYFYDQFVELHNSSSDTLYLDNLILTRQLGVIDPDMENKDYVRAIYAFKLPGTGRQWPIAPQQFVVVAADAVNHKQWCPDGADLSHADYEFFNALGNDYDVLTVPNFESITTRTTDFLINLVHNAVVLATSEEWTIDEDNYVRIPIANVIDGVEYSANPSATKEMTLRIDAGFAGIGITRYSAVSTERREPGFDSNNSTFDFINVSPPTPGYTHGEPAWVQWR